MTAESSIELDVFAADARRWLDANRTHAPRDYGAILPPGLREDGVSWQRRLFDAGWAGIHWPVRHGGRGLTRAHQAVWLEECARVDVQPFVNMVGFVLAGQGLLL
ncbi:MAG: acyl-CoA dehydrogenase family protein, partial [Acidimicrobiia bacterium]|nr:acyl-CoA dehydrogenase family protein [Acidimicrobiia bacterium]